jgi:hypothetical protein
LGRGEFEIEFIGDIVNMIELAETNPQTRSTASNEAAVPDVYQSSVKVVAGAGNQRYLHLNAVTMIWPIYTSLSVV